MPTPWTSASAVALATTILVVNARYVLYGATLRPWLGGVRGWQAYGTLSILADGNWILSSRAREGGEADAGYVFGSGLVMFVGWLVGTVLGALLGRLIADPEALGLDFLLVTFCAAALVPAYEGGRTLLCACHCRRHGALGIAGRWWRLAHHRGRDRGGVGRRASRRRRPGGQHRGRNGMSVDPAFVPLLLAMAAVTLFSRTIGFFAMRFVPDSRRLEPH